MFCYLCAQLDLTADVDVVYALVYSCQPLRQIYFLDCTATYASKKWWTVVTGSSS